MAAAAVMAAAAAARLPLVLLQVQLVVSPQAVCNSSTPFFRGTFTAYLGVYCRVPWVTLQ